MHTSSLVRLSLALAALTLSACPKVPDADPLEPTPRVLAFTASANEVATGDRVTLTWSTEGGTTVRIDDVRLGAVSGASAPSGSVEVAINDDTLFVLTVRNERGASDSAVVAVRATTSRRGELLFTAVPNEVKAGESATLAWLAPGVSAVVLTDAAGNVVPTGAQTSSGSVVVSPTVDTTWTLTAGTRTATATVRVLPALLEFTASPLAADAGSTVTLSWRTASASRVQLVAPGRAPLVDSTDAGFVTSGQFTDTLPTAVDPGQLFPYELIVTGAGTTLRDTRIVTIAGAPAITSFTAPARARSATAGPFADGGVGPSVVRLSWTTREAAELVIAADGTEFFAASPTQVAAGTLDVPTPAADTTYTLTVRGPRGGTASQSRVVQIVGLPTVTLTATPAMVTGGSPTTLSWQLTNTTGATVLSDGDGVVRVDPMGGPGSYFFYPFRSDTWTLRADNGVGDSASGSTTVTLTNPVTLSVLETGVLRSGQNVSVSWALPGGGSPPLVGLAHDRVDTRARTTRYDDISATGTQLSFPFSTNVASIVTTFRTTLFGRRVGERISVSRYGYLSFGEINGYNTTDVALPSQRLEPFSVAPYWDSLSNSAFWQVKNVAGVDTLIVQWNSSSASFQARLASTGQVDFEYLNLPTTVSGRAGITGRTQASTRVATPVADAGITFFGPITSPAIIRAVEDVALIGSAELDAGLYLPLTTTLGPVVSPAELSVSEVMANSTLGVPGQWVELRNPSERSLDLASWTFGLADGGVVALSGTVPSRGTLVLGATTDGALNDDAGVSVALANFDLTGISTFVFGRDGAHDTVPLTADAGFAVAHDVGPYRPTSAATSCPATVPFGSQTVQQRGTPGRDTGCGFPYLAVEIPERFRDIADGGVRLSAGDDAIVTLDLSAHPVPVFGTPRTSVQVSTNGFLTFDSASASSSNYHSLSNPSTTDSNTSLVLFGNDLQPSLAVSGNGVFARYFAMGEDPATPRPHWVVQWRNYSESEFICDFSDCYDDSYDILNFEAKLFEDGVIEYHFGRMVSGNSDQEAAGTDSVTWLENPTGTQALTINVKSAVPGIAPFTAFRFVPR